MLEKLFGFDAGKMSLRTEVIAGLTTFLTMAYVLAVHPAMMADTGMDKGAVFTATAVVAAVTSFLMAVIAKLPFALAPGMGMNAMFAYTICLLMGYSWHFALTAVFLESIIFLLLTAFNLWDKIMDAIPASLKTSISAGIGFFITFVGLKNAGVVVSDPSTLVRLGDLTLASPLLALIGIVITAVLFIKRVPGSLLLGILITAILGIPMGVTHFEGFFSTPPSMAPVVFQMDWSQVFTLDMLVVLISLLFVDLFGIVGSIIGLSSQILGRQGLNFSYHKVFAASSLAVLVGSIMGSSAVVAYIENATGVKAGGRTGLTAMVVAGCFLLALFFAPFFMAIPSSATTPVLVLVGLMMMSNILKLDLVDFSEALPAILCIVIMTLSFSIADGIIVGHLSYVLINLFCGNRKKLTVGMYVLALIFFAKFFI